MVNAQYNLLNHFGIDKLFSIAGGSMNASSYYQQLSDKSKTVIPIATTSSHSAQNIAFNELGRQAITADSDWKDGNYTLNNTNLEKDCGSQNGSPHNIFVKKGLQENWKNCRKKILSLDLMLIFKQKVI